MTGVVLGRAYYSRSALELAPDMLGKLLCRRFDDGTVGRFRIVETEAYFGEEDTACHAHRCSTGRARVMYSAGGLAYVHRCHMYNLLTIVTGTPRRGPDQGRGRARRSRKDRQGPWSGALHVRVSDVPGLVPVAGGRRLPHWFLVSSPHRHPVRL